MKDIKQIKDDIRKMVQDTVESGAIGNVQFFTIRAMQDFGDIQGDGADLYTICARETVTGIVKQAVNRYSTIESEAPLLDGFECLRTAYPVHREGDHLLMPVHLCTDEELQARAADFIKQSKTLRKHAKEIMAYIAARQKGAAQSDALASA